MWNNLLVFSGICLFSLNTLSSSKSMEFPNSKFTATKQTRNQRIPRVDTSALRKLTRRNASNVETTDHSTSIIGRELNDNFFIWRGTGPSANEGNSTRSCFTNHSSDPEPSVKYVMKTIINKLSTRADSDSLYELRQTSLNNRTNVNTVAPALSNQRRLIGGRVKHFKSQLSLNGCDSKTCEITVRKNSHREGDTDNATGNDNPINERLMRTKRYVLKAHHRFSIAKKIRSGRLNISPTDYPINLNFHPATGSSFNQTNEFRADRSSTRAHITTLTVDRTNIHANQPIRTAGPNENANCNVSGNQTSFAKAIKNNPRRSSNCTRAQSYDNNTVIKNNTGQRSTENQYFLNTVKLKRNTQDRRNATIAKNNRIKRQSRYENISNPTAATALLSYTTESSVGEMEIDENNTTSHAHVTTPKGDNQSSMTNFTKINHNIRNETAIKINKNKTETILSNDEITTKSPVLPAENLTLFNRTRAQSKNKSESEELRRLASSCATSSTNTTKNTIFILGLFALTKGSSERRAGESETAAASLAVKHINQMQILGCEYELQMLVNNTQEDPGVALNNFFYAMYKDQQKKIKALLGSSNAEVTHALAKITLAWDIPTISFGFSSPQLSDNKKYPMFFRTVAPDSSHNQARIAFLHFFKWNAITTICQQEDLYSWGINDLSTKLEESNITQGKTISFSEQDFEAHLKLMPEEGSKIIVGSFSNKVAPKIFCTVYDMGLYGGDYVWILPGTLENRWWNTNKYCAKQKLIKAVNGLILISSKKQLDEDEYAVSFVNEKEFQNLLPTLKSEFVREAYDAVWAAALSLNRTLSWCKNSKNSCLSKSFHKSFQKQFVNNFQHIQFKGTSGPILFHGADRICITNFYQIQDGEIFPIAQYDPLTLKLNFNCSSCKEIIWPSGYIPVSKRTYELHIMNITPVAFYVINSFAVLGILVSLCFLIFNIYYREQKYIKLSSPYLNATTILGCILVYLAVIFLGIDNSTMPPAFNFQTVCTARVALLSTGCSLAFGSIFAKTYRVHQIFIKSNHGILKSKVLQDSRLVPIIGVFVLIDGVIIVIWTAIDPMEHDLYNLTLEASVAHPEIIHQLQVEVCKSEYKNTWLFALGIYKAVFFILGLYMAWETRNVKIPSLNDSEYIGLTVYTVLITTVLHFTLANVTSDRITLAYVTTTSLILFTTTSSMCLLFLPKINAIFKHKDLAHKKIVSSADLKIESNTIRFVKNDDQEPYYRVHIQNFAYRKYVAFLDREIQNLHYKVYIKKNDDPDLLARRATKIYDKLPNLRKYRREKSSSLCGGIPNLFMLTVFPVVIPRASWPYAEHLDRPITEEMSFSSETKLQSIRFDDSALNPKHRDSEDEDQPKCDGSIPSSPLKRIFDNDEYQDTSSDVEEDHNQPNSVLKICKAIVHSPLSNDELKKLEQTPKIMITDTEAQNEDNNREIIDEQLEI